MPSFKSFIIKLPHVKLNLEYVNGSKNGHQLASQLTDISEKMLGGYKWYELEKGDERLKLHNSKYDDYNVMFVSLNKKYCVIDTDGEEEHNVINYFFK